jgi:serine/threonine protein kinase
LKQCPYCKEEIHDEAVKCKHCRSMLSDAEADVFGGAVSPEGTNEQPQYDTLDVAVTQGREATVLAGKYSIIEKLSDGETGVVYLAEDIEHANQPIAIKVLPPLLSNDKNVIENLREEAIIAMKLDHPNIVRLYGFNSDGDIKFLVMEYINGVTLEDKILNSPSNKLDLDETIKIAQQIAKALDYAYSQSPPVIHRGLKSSNVIIDRSGDVKVLGFCVAREIYNPYTTMTSFAKIEAENRTIAAIICLVTNILDFDCAEIIQMLNFRKTALAVNICLVTDIFKFNCANIIQVLNLRKIASRPFKSYLRPAIIFIACLFAILMLLVMFAIVGNISSW